MILDQIGLGYIARTIATFSSCATVLFRVGDAEWVYVSAPRNAADAGASLWVGPHKWWTHCGGDDVQDIVCRWLDNGTITLGPRVEQPT